MQFGARDCVNSDPTFTDRPEDFRETQLARVTYLECAPRAVAAVFDRENNRKKEPTIGPVERTVDEHLEPVIHGAHYMPRLMLCAVAPLFRWLGVYAFRRPSRRELFFHPADRFVDLLGRKLPEILIDYFAVACTCHGNTRITSEPRRSRPFRIWSVTRARSCS